MNLKGISFYLSLICFPISILAFINILPIPGLDGGHIFLHTIEALIRRPLTLRTRIVIQQIGMSFLLLLMLTVMFNDINRFF